MFLCLLWDLLSFGPMAYGNALTKTLDKSEITRTQNQSRKKKLYFFYFISFLFSYFEINTYVCVTLN